MCLFVLLLVNEAFAAGVSSSYAALDSDVHDIRSNGVAILNVQVVNVPPGQDILVSSDGRWYPQGGAVALATIIFSSSSPGGEGSGASSASVIDWETSLYPVQHCLNVILPFRCTAGGNFSFTLIASSLNGDAFAVGAGTNLAAFVLPPGAEIASSALTSDSPTLKFDVPASATVLPTYVALSVSTPPSAANSTVFALSSGRSYQVDGPDHQGDAVWFISANNITDQILCNQSMRADNDMYADAEGGNAPMYTHAQFPRSSTSDKAVMSVDLLASGESWTFCCNKVHYRLGAQTTLVALSGLSSASGSVSLANGVNAPSTFVCVGTSKNWPGCPHIGTTFTMINATFHVPAGHSGTFYFSFKSLVQADSSDVGGTLSAQIGIDGQRVGSTAVQQLTTPDSVSTRTVTASYLATSLKSGDHVVSVLVDVEGSFIHLCLERSLPLVWFG